MVAKYSHIKFNKNPSNEEELFHEDGNTDGKTDVTESLFATARSRLEKKGIDGGSNVTSL
jgi:hypothetical protein